MRSGNIAEQVAAIVLSKHGFSIVSTNWRTRWCEIDIVAKRNSTIYFIEVKYRASDSHGDGLEYITARKQQQMRFAARLWCTSNSWQGGYELLAVAISGKRYIVDSVRLIDQ